MAVGNTFFKKWASHLVTYESGPSKTQAIFWQVETKQNF